jgi:hypothetical protein
VLLRTTAKTRGILERLAPYQVRINDVLFEQLGAKRFREVRALLRELVASGERAAALLGYLMREAA